MGPKNDWEPFYLAFYLLFLFALFIYVFILHYNISDLFKILKHCLFPGLNKMDMFEPHCVFGSF